MILATIGYEQASLEDFIATLQLAEVTTLIDVRQLPVSRRKGFSKNALAAALENAGVHYVHLIGLGDPKEGRDAVKDGNYGEFLKIYASHMETPQFKADMEKAVVFVEQGEACLMCYERAPSQCHRKLVAESLSGIISLEVKHLGVQVGAARNGRKSRARKSFNSREGASPGR